MPAKTDAPIWAEKTLKRSAIVSALVPFGAHDLYAVILVAT
jgi:hypothetical protein